MRIRSWKSEPRCRQSESEEEEKWAQVLSSYLTMRYVGKERGAGKVSQGAGNLSLKRRKNEHKEEEIWANLKRFFLPISRRLAWLISFKDKSQRPYYNDDLLILLPITCYCTLVPLFGPPPHLPKSVLPCLPDASRPVIDTIQKLFSYLPDMLKTPSLPGTSLI